jgi:hypothetical protein
MWWEPQDDQQGRTKYQVDNLLSNYREMLSGSDFEPVIWGVGSAVDFTGQWLPLVLVSYEELSREYPNVPAGLQMTFSVFAGRYPAAGRIIALISGWQSNGQILVRLATRPVVANRVGSGSVT